MELTEEQTRAKVVELLDMRNLARFNMWVESGILTGVLDSCLVERVMNEEIGNRSLDVQLYWMAPCDLCTPLDQCQHN